MILGFSCVFFFFCVFSFVFFFFFNDTATTEIYTLSLHDALPICATPASFEPTIDYVVTKIPRFDFEKFPQADTSLTTQMKSVGEVMAIGRTFQESFQKALRSLEIGRAGLDPVAPPESGNSADTARFEQALSVPNSDRIWSIGDAFRSGMTIDQVYDLTRIDRWFLAEIKDLIETEKLIQFTPVGDINSKQLRLWKSKGFSDIRLAALLGMTETGIRQMRHRSEEHTSELQSRTNLVCRLLLEKKKHIILIPPPPPHNQQL